MPKGWKSTPATNGKNLTTAEYRLPRRRYAPRPRLAHRPLRETMLDPGCSKTVLIKRIFQMHNFRFISTEPDGNNIVPYIALPVNFINVMVGALQDQFHFFIVHKFFRITKGIGTSRLYLYKNQPVGLLYDQIYL